MVQMWAVQYETVHVQFENVMQKTNSHVHIVTVARVISCYSVILPTLNKLLHESHYYLYGITICIGEFFRKQSVRPAPLEQLCSQFSGFTNPMWALKEFWYIVVELCDCVCVYRSFFFF